MSSAAEPPTPDRPHPLSDPRALRAYAHPLRMRIIGELISRGAMRVVDLANELDTPANSVSFHVRQLAKYGLIAQDAERAADGRERWWRIPSTQGYSMNPDEIAAVDGGTAALGAFRHQAERSAHALARAIYRSWPPREDEEATSPYLSTDFVVRLSQDELTQMKDEFFNLMITWMNRSRDLEDTKDGKNRRTIYSLMLAAPLSDVVDQPSAEATTVDESGSDD